MLYKSEVKICLLLKVFCHFVVIIIFLDGFLKEEFTVRELNNLSTTQML